MTPVLIAVCITLAVSLAFVCRQWQRYRQRYLSAQKKLTQQDAQIEQLTGQVEGKVSAIAQLNQRLENLQDKAEDSSHTLDAYQQEISTLQSTNQILTQQLEQQTARFSTQFEQANTQHQETIAALNDQMKALVKEKADLDTHLQNTEQSWSSLYHELEVLSDNKAQQYRVQIAELEAEIRQLKQDVQTAQDEQIQVIETGLLLQTTEQDLYPQERMAILLDVLNQTAKRGVVKGSRRATVIEDLLDSNNSKFYRDKLIAGIEKGFKAYDGMNAKLRRMLTQMNLELDQTGRHYKLNFRGDSRYKVTFAKTPSDRQRAGQNTLQNIKRQLL